jgi:hypothetical protein
MLTGNDARCAEQGGREGAQAGEPYRGRRRHIRHRGTLRMCHSHVNAASWQESTFAGQSKVGEKPHARCMEQGMHGCRRLH